MKGYFDQVIVGLLILAFITSLVFLSFNDFWQDELYSLEHFVFVNPTKTLTDYSNTNNHILYNLFFNIYLHLLPGVGMQEVLEYPILVRSVLLTFTILTGWLLWKKSAQYYGTTTAGIIAVIYFSSTAAIHFGVQARGYTFSGLFVTLQYFEFLKIKKYIASKRIKPALFLLYSILNMLVLPTSIYLSAAYFSVIAFYWIKAFRLTHYKKHDQTNVYNWTKVGVLYFFIIGGSVAYYKILYSQQPPNELIDAIHPLSFPKLRQSISIFHYFANYRIIVWILIAIAFCIHIVRTKRFKDLIPADSLLSSALFFLTFLFFFIHGTLIIQRTFIPLLPLFCVFAGTATAHGIKFIPKIWYRIFLVGSVLGFAISLVQARNYVIGNNSVSKHVHDLNQHYYLFNFNALETTKLAKYLTDKTGKELIVADSFGETGIYFYFRAFNIPYKVFDQQVLPGKVYIVNNKKEFELSLFKSAIPFTKLYSDTEQYNIYITRYVVGHRSIL